MKRIIQLILLLILILMPLNGFAVGSSGFENASYSAKSLAMGNAATASPKEPATIAFNPAGITELEGTQIQFSAGFINLFTRHKHDINGDTRNSGTTAIVTPTYITTNQFHLGDRKVSFGFGLDSPFGLANKYDSTHPISQYMGHRNWLKMVALKPTVAFEVNDWLSIGGGLVYNDIFDFGGILQYPNKLLGGPFPDGQVRAELSGSGWSWQIGLYAKPNEKHHFGLFFRAPSHIKTRGKIKVENATLGGSFETEGQAKLVLPLNITLGYAYRLNQKTDFEINLGFTRWSSFNRLYINSAPVGNPNDAILNAIGQGSANDKDWKNSFSLHFGANHQLNEKLTLIGGTFLYSNAVPNGHFSPNVPDSNIIAFTTGFSYQLKPNLLLDGAYMGRFWLPRNVDNSNSEAIGGSVDGKYSTYGQEIIISLTYKI